MMQVARREAWPEYSWSDPLTLLLMGEAQQAYYALPKEEANFITLHEKIHAWCGLTSTHLAGQFNHWTYSPRVEHRDQMDALLCIAH